MWYDVNKTLTHNALINIIIGPRGYGKTYALKKRAISEYIKKGKEFIYIRRYQAELDLVKEGLFNDIIVNNEFAETIEFKNDCYFYGGNLCGYAIALSRSNHYKSASFPFVGLIIFDEFIIDTSQNAHYLKNEVRKFLDFIETVGRMREDIKAFLLANSLSFINPYTLYWNMSMPKEKKYCKAVDGLVLLELVGDDEFKERKQNTLFGKLNAGTEYERMSVDNQFILDSDTFIEKRPGHCRYAFTLAYQNNMIGVWHDYKYGLFYMGNDWDPSCRLVYSTTLEDHKPNMMLLKRADKGGFGAIVRAFKIGAVRFENIRVKSIMTEIFKLTL